MSHANGESRWTSQDFCVSTASPPKPSVGMAFASLVPTQDGLKLRLLTKHKFVVGGLGPLEDLDMASPVFSPNSHRPGSLVHAGKTQLPQKCSLL